MNIKKHIKKHIKNVLAGNLYVQYSDEKITIETGNNFADSTIKVSDRRGC